MAIAAHDFSSPYFSAAIVLADGSRYPITLDGIATGGNSGAALTLSAYTGNPKQTAQVTFAALSFATDVSVEIGLGLVPKLTVNLAPPLEEARKLIDSNLVDFGATRLEVVIGYASGYGPNKVLSRSPTFRGLIQPPDVSFGTDISVSLTGQGTGGYFLSATGVSGAKEKLTRRDWIAKLAKESKVEWFNQADFFPAYKDLKTKSGKTYTADQVRAAFKSEELQQARLIMELLATKMAPDIVALMSVEQTMVVGNNSKLAIIYELARECGCQMLIEDTGFSILPLKQILNGKIAAVFRLFDFGNGSIGAGTDTYVLPILSVTSETKGIFVGKEARSAIYSGVDPLTGEIVRTQVSFEKDAVQTTDTGGVAQQTEETQGSEVRPGDASTQPEFDKQARELLQMVSTEGNSQGIKLEIETIGVPDLVPGMIVAVQGVSKRIDGKFYITNLKHNVSTSGFSTSVSLQQNVNTFFAPEIPQRETQAPNEAPAPAEPPPVGDEPKAEVKPAEETGAKKAKKPEERKAAKRKK